MKRWKTLTAALVAAAPFVGGGALAQTPGGGAEAPAAKVQQLSDAELSQVLDTIHAITKGDWREGYISGLTQTTGYLHGSFVMSQVRAQKLTQEAADKIKAEIDRIVEKLTNDAKGEGSQYDGQAAGTKALIDAFKDAVTTMGADEMIPADVAETLAQSADRLTGRADPSSLMQSAMRGITSTHLNVYGLANNRAVSEQQVETIVAALNDVKEAFPGASDAIDTQIFKVANLTIGRKAPNIKGVDTDEVEFELKDYLGKVVVLDFWGDW